MLTVSAGTDGQSDAGRMARPASDPATLGNPANEIGFRIERAVNGGAFAVLGTALANATSFTDNTILPAAGTRIVSSRSTRPAIRCRMSPQ